VNAVSLTNALRNFLRSHVKGQHALTTRPATATAQACAIATPIAQTRGIAPYSISALVLNRAQRPLKSVAKDRVQAVHVKRIQIVQPTAIYPTKPVIMSSEVKLKPVEPSAKLLSQDDVQPFQSMLLATEKTAVAWLVNVQTHRFA
tara:strand:- start:2 stop:439 length:438 start_codon:yes stop_codon:yes gene_type:complete